MWKSCCYSFIILSDFPFKKVFIVLLSPFAVLELKRAVQNTSMNNVKEIGHVKEVIANFDNTNFFIFFILYLSNNFRKRRIGRREREKREDRDNFPDTDSSSGYSSIR